MYNDKLLSFKSFSCFNYKETKSEVNNYFIDLEKLKWEWAKLNAQKGLTANYDFSVEYKKKPYIPFGKDVFKISAKNLKEEEIKQYISNYYWAESILSDMEKAYIKECFINRKSEEDLIGVLGFYSPDSNRFRKLKKSAVYKFADFLNLVVEK